MKTMIKSTVVVAIVCLLAVWTLHETAATTSFPNVQTTGYQANIQADTAAIMTEQFLERLPEIATH